MSCRDVCKFIYWVVVDHGVVLIFLEGFFGNEKLKKYTLNLILGIADKKMFRYFFDFWFSELGQK